MIKRKIITDFFNSILKPDEFKDITFNGIQVEGTEIIKKIAFSVDTSLDIFHKTVVLKCDMLVAHHGLIWKFKPWDKITGTNRNRIKFLLENNINLYISHLPLDKNPVFGNNVELLKLLKAEKHSDFGEAGYLGTFKKNISFVNLVNQLKTTVNKNLDFYQFGEPSVKTIAVSSGGFNSSLLYEAIEKGADTIITGEAIGKSTFFYPARENRLNIIFAGHYHTETLGIKELMKKTKEHFKNKVDTVFIDMPNEW